MSDRNDIVRRATRVYEVLLWFLPRSHRREYGALMVQLFRDQCRDACRHGRGWALINLWFGALLDLAGSAFREHLTQQIERMKNIPPNKLSLILVVTALGASLLGVRLALVPGHSAMVVGLIYFSGLVFLVRAAVEWVRPEQELFRSLLWGASIAVIYALIMPVLAKLRVPMDPLGPMLLVVAVFLNGLVPLFKSARRVWRRLV
jgi:predicted neutral ceramidase superfamily lipid hydrolase